MDTHHSFRENSGTVDGHSAALQGVLRRPREMRRARFTEMLRVALWNERHVPHITVSYQFSRNCFFAVE